MMTDRQSRISLLARTNYSRIGSDGFLAELSTAIGRQIAADSLLPINISDQYRSAFSSGYRKSCDQEGCSYRSLQSAEGFGALEEKVMRLSNRLAAEPAILLPTHFEQCVRVTVGELLSRPKSMLEFDRDTLALTSLDGESGFMLDWNPDDMEWTFELAIWGEHWAGDLV
jgi:hypothetical protein